MPLGSICKCPTSSYKALLVSTRRATCLSVHNLVPTGGMTTMLDDFTPHWQGKGTVREAYRRTCPPGSPARQLYSSRRNPNVQKADALLRNSQGSDDSFAFAETVDNDYDFCKSPWAHYTRGTFSLIGERFRCSLPCFLPRNQRGLQTSGYLVTTIREEPSVFIRI